jgi:hypothetical protein
MPVWLASLQKALYPYLTDAPFELEEAMVST